MHVVDLNDFLHAFNKFLSRLTQSISTAQKAVLKNFHIIIESFISFKALQS